MLLRRRRPSAATYVVRGFRRRRRRRRAHSLYSNPRPFPPAADTDLILLLTPNHQTPHNPFNQKAPARSSSARRASLTTRARRRASRSSACRRLLFVDVVAGCCSFGRTISVTCHYLCCPSRRRRPPTRAPFKTLAAAARAHKKTRPNTKHTKKTNRTTLTQARGLPRHPAQQQPRDDHDRPGHGRPHLRRAHDAGVGRTNLGGGAPGRDPADDGRPDGVEPGQGAVRGWWCFWLGVWWCVVLGVCLCAHAVLCFEGCVF